MGVWVAFPNWIGALRRFVLPLALGSMLGLPHLAGSQSQSCKCSLRLLAKLVTDGWPVLVQRAYELLADLFPLPWILHLTLQPQTSGEGPLWSLPRVKQPGLQWASPLGKASWRRWHCRWAQGENKAISGWDHRFLNEVGANPSREGWPIMEATRCLALSSHPCCTSLLSFCS